MKKERMKILDMVENGLISAEDAKKLLEAISSTGNEKMNGENFVDDMEDKFGELVKNLENFGKYLNSNVKETYKGMEPKFKMATKTVVGKTASVVEEISNSLKETYKNMENTNCCEEGNCEESSSCCTENANDEMPREN